MDFGEYEVMIPSDIRLYTWIDVEDVLFRVQQENRWPAWLVWARAYWDGLTLGIRPGTQSDALQWLTDRFEPRFSRGNIAIALESIEGQDRWLNVHFEETEEEPISPPFAPTLARPTVLWQPSGKRDVSHLACDLPPVVAFHSFKGGVGRTLHALALASILTERTEKARVLIVDADLEAPGLSWLLQRRLPAPPISFVDFLALIHGDSDPSMQNSIKLVTERLGDSRVDNCYVLPAFRSAAQYSSLEIRPDHLVQGADDPYLLTSMLARLGKALNVRAVIVDLRAGLSELSAGLLLDPRVYRVIVTTLSSQSIDGTCRLLALLGEAAPSKSDLEPLPAIIISQVPKEYLQKESLLNDPIENLLEAGKVFWRTEEDESGNEPPIIVNTYDSRFAVLPGEWGEVMRLIHQSDLKEKLSILSDWLPGIDSCVLMDLDVPADREASRNKLADYARRLVYAETADIEEFLTIYPLHHLGSSFTQKVPVAIIVGAKGAGKTYTFMQIARRGKWEKFAHDARVPEVSISALICPVLQSKNLGGDSQKITSEVKIQTSETLGLCQPVEAFVVADYVRDSLKQNLHESQWRDRWLDIVAWCAGFEVKSEGSGRRFIEYLRQKKKYIIAILDGLEDLFQTLSSNENQQIAVRSLLQDVPEWLEQQPLRPLGLLVFVRQDMVLNAIKQNPAQLMARYEPFALKWNYEEALRLAVWISVEAGALPSLDINMLPEMGKAELVDALVPLWGRKLGSENSKEARSAEWVISALSDLKGQIQARDLVRFLKEAAISSVGDSYWKDRLLIPTAIRKSLGDCSKEKVSEIAMENPSLGEIFSQLKELSDDLRLIPFSAEQVGLDTAQLEILETNGVILREKGEYYMPEIFRLGLGFKLKAGARPRVLMLARRSRKWSS